MFLEKSIAFREMCTFPQLRNKVMKLKSELTLIGMCKYKKTNFAKENKMGDADHIIKGI